MFGIGGFELFIILIFGFLILGPDKLPEVAQLVGKGIARFREAQKKMNDTLGDEKIFDPNNPDEPFKNPVEVLDRVAQRQEEQKRAAKAAQESVPAKAAGKSAAAPASGGQSVKPAVAQETLVEETVVTETAVVEEKQESFTERKARYERDRAAKKAAGTLKGGE